MRSLSSSLTLMSRPSLTSKMKNPMRMKKNSRMSDTLGLLFSNGVQIIDRRFGLHDFGAGASHANKVLAAIQIHAFFLNYLSMGH